MSPQSEITIAIATGAIPFLAVGGLMWLSRRVRQRKAVRIATQIALTDAIHWELGAAAAPEMRRGWLGGWTVSMAVPLEREGTVGAVVRIAHEFFSKLEPGEASPIRIVLTPQQRSRARQAAVSPVPGRAAGRLTRAGARLG